jgi:hypothetical protein
MDGRCYEETLELNVQVTVVKCVQSRNTNACQERPEAERGKHGFFF